MKKIESIFYMSKGEDVCDEFRWQGERTRTWHASDGRDGRNKRVRIRRSRRSEHLSERVVVGGGLSYAVPERVKLDRLHKYLVAAEREHLDVIYAESLLRTV